MQWTDLASQFSLELAFGVLVAIAFVPKAPVGALFYRLMGSTALVPVLVAVGAPLWTGDRSWNDPALVLASLAVVTFPFYAGAARGRTWGAALGIAILGTGAAVGTIVVEGAPELGALELALAVASALATGAVAGSVGLAMVLGHWYLTIPKLAIRHLRRLNRVTIAVMIASACLVTATCVALREPLNAGATPLFGAMGLFFLATRFAVGLVFPLAFAAMAASSLRFQNTRSATGILYASTVLVLIGTAVSVSLQDSYGVPL